MRSITVVGTGTTSRIPEVLARPGTHITLIANAGCSMRHSRFVDRFVPLDYETLFDLAPALLERPELFDDFGDWVIYSEDQTPLQLARSELALDVKRRVLPARLEAGLSMLGSKAGLARLQNALGVGPRSEVVEHREDLVEAIADFAPPFLMKGDRGGGGLCIRLVDMFDRGDTEGIPDDWFPVVLQEHLHGTEASVEVAFRDGTLVGWLYSNMLSAAGGFGPSTSRRYLTPPSTDFVDALQALGQAGGLHGFFNCSLMWSPQEGRHHVFELDPRPNAWHQFGPRLGVDWNELMLGPAGQSTLSARVPDRGRVVHLYPREVIDGFNRREWQSVRPWLTSSRGTSRTRNRRDTAVNAADRQDVRQAAVSAARLSLAIGMVKAWSQVPVSMRRGLDRSVLRQAVASRLPGAVSGA